ncbi:MAG: glycosyltransferase family 4 protein [Actinobacteria bacterium]|nr:glycosyltransferase family 4 protein [Actinomycetota bacterium]MCG2799943.1 glycosyltransferase family 4 protein [Cellulomonas sp.]
MSSYDQLTVALVFDDDLDRPDGVQQYVLTLADGLRRRGHDVHLIAPATVRTDLPNLHVIGRHITASINGNRVRTPLGAPASQVNRLLAQVRPDVLHIQMPHSPLLAGRFVRAAPADMAVVGTFHIAAGSRLAEAGGRLLGTVERRELRRFDTVLTMSDAGREFAESAFGLTTTPATMPVHLHALPPDGPPTPDDGGPVRILFLGRLVERKGARELLAALELLASQRLAQRPWTAELAGAGPQARSLAKFVAERGLADLVTFTGFVDEQKKAALLGTGDLVVLPSTRGESFGISVVEALAAARGVVLAGDNPGYRTPMAGLERQLVEPRDAWTFARTLARWVDDPAGRAAAVGPQRTRAARFDAELAVSETEAAYRAALERRRLDLHTVG